LTDLQRTKSHKWAGLRTSCMTRMVKHVYYTMIIYVVLVQYSVVSGDSVDVYHI